MINQGDHWDTDHLDQSYQEAISRSLDHINCISCIDSIAAGGQSLDNRTPQSFIRLAASGWTLDDGLDMSG